ncbi:MAG: hypothetical protein DI617_06255, partial [Streptococcus pyogenes]
MEWKKKELGPNKTQWPSSGAFLKSVRTGQDSTEASLKKQPEGAGCFFGSIISVVGKSTLEMMGLFHADKKSHMTYNEK